MKEMDLISTEREEKIVELDMYVLTIDKLNKHFHIYSKKIVDKWLDLAKKNEDGIEIEYAVTSNDLSYDYLKDADICGIVTNLYYDGSKLFAKVKIDINIPEFEYIYNNEDALRTKCCLVPKGSGIVREQTILDDYELIGFNLILWQDSSYCDGDNPPTSTVLLHRDIK